MINFSVGTSTFLGCEELANSEAGLNVNFNAD